MRYRDELVCVRIDGSTSRRPSANNVENMPARGSLTTEFCVDRKAIHVGRAPPVGRCSAGKDEVGDRLRLFCH